NTVASAAITVDAGGRMTTGDYVMTSPSGFVLNGALEVAVNKTFTVTATRHFLNNGHVTGTMSIINAAIAQGTGAYDVLKLVDIGAVDPGATTGLVAGVVTINTLTMTDTSASGSPIVQLELGGTVPGTQYDQVHVSGTATFSGTLIVSFINGFSP